MRAKRSLLVVSVSMVYAGGFGCSTPQSSDPSIEGDMQMLIVSGDGQSGVVATELAKPVVVQVLNKKRPVAGQVVNFVVTTASDPLSTKAGSIDAAAPIPSIADTVFKGQVYAGTAVTDSNGKAEDFWTLGARTSYPQKLEVRAADLASGKQVFAAFTATALPGPATRLSMYADSKMPPFGIVDAGSQGPRTQKVTVYDVLGNPVPGFTVNFAVTGGGGSVRPVVVKTGAEGTAQADWTMGSTQNMENTLSITAQGLSGSPITMSSYVGCSTGQSCGYNTGVCANLQSDPNNCGWCGQKCASNSACVNGMCQCSGGGADGGAMTLCGQYIEGGFISTCVNTQNDPNNCGWCNNKCPSDSRCVNGGCQCAGGEADAGAMTVCWLAGGQACVNTQNDPNNCGMCGHTCASNTTCVNGGCQCQGSQSLCYGPFATMACTDLQTDPSNCGFCGNQCPGSSACVAGLCQCADGSGVACLANGTVACVDLQSDPNNCGGCGRMCGPESEVLCKEGQCIWCPQGTIYCKGLGRCISPLGDSQNCGGCGLACKTGAFCNYGQCACWGGTVDCGTHCAYLGGDVDNCGSCGNACPSGLRVCSDGQCQSCASVYGPNYGECNGSCTDLRWDLNNCGACGTQCGRNAVCIQGGCVSGQ